MQNTTETFLRSIAEQAKPLRGVRVLLWSFSGRGFPGGDGAAEAVEYLPRTGVDVTYSNAQDPEANEKLSKRYDISIVCNMRVGAVLAYDPRIWTCASQSVWWAWDLRPGSIAKPLKGRPSRVFLSFNGPWTAPGGIVYEPEQWARALGCPVGYCPQGAPQRRPREGLDGARVLFVGDLANRTYHQGRGEICRALGATVLNSKERSGRLEIERRMPELYRTARYVLSMSPRAPGYTSVRTYSILACGGLMLLHRFAGAEKLFRDGEHVVMFDSVDDLKPRLAKLDEDPEARRRIADAGRRLHASRHTVAHRVLSICREVMGVSNGFGGWL